MKAYRTRHTAARICALCFSVVYLGLLLVFIAIFGMTEPFWLLLLVPWILAAAVIFYRILLSYSAVRLEDEGVYTRILFRTYFYPWRDIQRIGVLRGLRRGVPNQLVLLRTDAAPKHGRDWLFGFRHLGKMIVIPDDSPEVRAFLVSHHGTLDFDSSNG